MAKRNRNADLNRLRQYETVIMALRKQNGLYREALDSGDATAIKQALSIPDHATPSLLLSNVLDAAFEAYEITDRHDFEEFCEQGLIPEVKAVKKFYDAWKEEKDRKKLSPEHIAAMQAGRKKAKA
jgi:hypothetical protein